MLTSARSLFSVAAAVLLSALTAAALALPVLSPPSITVTEPAVTAAEVQPVASATGSGNLTPSSQPVVGFADLHNHQFANLGFGGLLLWGEPFHEQGMSHALPWSDFMPSAPGEVVAPDGSPVPRFGCGGVGVYSHCPPTCPPGTGPGTDQWCEGVAIHGAGGLGNILQAVLSGTWGHNVGGYPQFDGWPRWNNYTGQQAYVDWVERSWLGGQRLMVMLAVNNESLCSLVNRRASFGCDDMSAVDRQIQGAKNLERYVDRADDGLENGTGWYRIAYTSAQARQFAAAGKLAVVLGIEVPSLFGCKPASGCTVQQVQERLDHYYGLGVRHILPVHNTDNAFAGTALYNEIFAANNRIITGDWWDVENCDPATGIDFHAGMTDDPLFSYFAGLAGETVPEVPEGSSCNARGLTSLGEAFMGMLMDKKMVIDLDHLSTKSLNRSLDLAEARNYPALAMSHSGFLGSALPGGAGRHEGNKTDQQLERIRALGGTVATILHQGGRQDVKEYQRPDGSVPVPFDCGESSKAWAQAYLYAVEKMQGRAVAIGSDFNGLAGMPAPRAGSEACHGDKPANYSPGAQVQYPFTTRVGTSLGKQVVGDREFDYNVDGLANNGLLPDFIEDLERIGLTDADLDPLFGSAEQYIRMWELSEDTTPPAISCGTADGAWHASNVSVTCTASDAVAGLADASDASFTLTTNVPDGSETSNAQTDSRRVCDARGNCADAGPVAGHQVDRKAPVISLVSPSPGTYTVGESLVADYACTDAGSGLSSCVGTLPHGAAVDTSTAGSYSFTVRAADTLDNRSQETAPYVVSYRICLLYDDTAAKPLGSVVPLRFMLCDVAGNNLSTSAVAVTAAGLTKTSTETSGVVEDAGNANPDAGFRYSAGLGSSGGYIYNLSTKGLTTGTWAMHLYAAGDPTRHRLPFQLR